VIDAWWDAGRLTHARMSPRIDSEVVISIGLGFCLRADDGTVLEEPEGRFQIHLREDKIYMIERKEEGNEC
jgi:hypothetical protein